MASASTESEVVRTRSWTVYAVAALVAASTMLFHIQSYWWSESITLCDVTLTADEGLVSLNVPLVRLAANQSPQRDFTIYERAPKGWTAANGAGKTPLRAWMAFTNEPSPRAMFADFGYWKGDWQTDARPGPFVVLFVPVWFVGLMVFLAFLAIRAGYVRFRLRSILIAMTFCAIVLYILTLRAPAIG